MMPFLVLAVAAVCLLASLMPLVPAAHGAVRVFDFARLQVATLAVVSILLTAVSWASGPAHPVALVMAVAALAIQSVQIAAFTPLWRRQTARHQGEPDRSDTISVIACNVKQGNRDYSRVAALVEEQKPDVAVFMEVDEDWEEALRPCLSGFEEVVSYPQSNTYGMILASRLPMRDSAVRFLLNDEVPSIDCVVTLPSGKEVRIVALHPEPPVPTQDTMGRDAEILMVGKMARKETMPMIVTGDLNDVAWSRTTRRFLRISRLLDPRQGRGLFNSFHAEYPFLRWPLDHIFHSRHFSLVALERLAHVGSDHFPMYYSLVLDGGDRNAPPPHANGDDVEEAKEEIETEKSRDRSPVGTDWEDG